MARLDKTQVGTFICPCCGKTEESHNYLVTFDHTNITAYTGHWPPQKRGFGFPIWHSTAKFEPPEG